MTDRLVLDAGALIAIERNDRAAWARVRVAAEDDVDVVVPPGALAQVWRGRPEQARLAQALKNTRLGDFDRLARSAGELCAASGVSDPIDASVVLNAAGSVSVILTSDLRDIRRLVRVLPPDQASRISVVRT